MSDSVNVAATREVKNYIVRLQIDQLHRLRTDWDGSTMADGAEPMDSVRCVDLRMAGRTIAILAEALEHILRADPVDLALDPQQPQRVAKQAFIDVASSAPA